MINYIFSEFTSKAMERIVNINEAPASPEQWDRLISKSLTGSEFDLLVHHDENVRTPQSI